MKYTLILILLLINALFLVIAIGLNIYTSSENIIEKSIYTEYEKCKELGGTEFYFYPWKNDDMGGIECTSTNNLLN